MTHYSSKMSTDERENLEKVTREIAAKRKQASPPSREPGQAGVPDALERRLRNEVSIHVSLSGEDELSRDILAVLADRAHDRERIGALQMRIEVRSRERHEQHRVSVTLPVWDKCPEDLCMADRALLEVQDAE